MKIRWGVAVAWLALACASLASCGGGSDVPAEVQALLELDRGIELENASNFERAHDAYATAIDIDPNFAEAYARRGRSYLRYENLRPSLADLNKAIEIDPDLAIGHLYRGMFMAKIERWDEASLDMTKSIELDPSNVDAYLQRSRLFAERDEPESGLADLDSAI
ncbi:MAG: hypothetical protein QGI88_03795, partial [SAR202 cluster bacterium]|nr:hypothetical protein [SAR202 cluster bacterium]